MLVNVSFYDKVPLGFDKMIKMLNGFPKCLADLIADF